MNYLAPLLNKPAGKFNWVLETDKVMSKAGPDNADKPFVWLKLDSINSYDDPEKVKSLTPLLYTFMQTELKLEKVKYISHLRISYRVSRTGLSSVSTSSSQLTWPTTERPLTSSRR